MLAAAAGVAVRAAPAASRHPTGNSPPRQPTGNGRRHVTSGIRTCHEMPVAARVLFEVVQCRAEIRRM